MAYGQRKRKRKTPRSLYREAVQMYGVEAVTSPMVKRIFVRIALRRIMEESHV